MIGMLRCILGRGRAETRSGEPSLPPGFVPRLEQKSFFAVQAEWQDLLSKVPESFAAVIAAAEAAGWSSREMRRLTAFGHYYCGDLDSAFEQARINGLAYAEDMFDPELFLLVVNCLYHRGQIEEARRVLEAIETRHPALHGRADFWQGKAAIEFAGNDLELAWRSLLTARKLAPADAGLAMNIYSLAFQLEEWSTFTALENEIKAGSYGDSLNAFAVATPYLANNDYTTGFALLEKRYKQADAPHYVNPTLPEGRRWTGLASEFPPGKILLITCEQGFGDIIMMARYFVALYELTSGRLIIETQRELLPLFESNFPRLRFVPREHGKPPPLAFDLWLGAMSLPYVFADTAETIPGKTGYLAAPHETLAYWRQRSLDLLPASPRIGLAWSGNPRHLNDRQRSIPFACIAEHLSGLGGVIFVAVQTTRLPAEKPSNLIDVADELITFADTAALLATLDLIVTVDTSLVHLAGALGKEAWLLLPRRYEWRWGIEGEKNAWYDSVKVLRQKKRGDWDSLLTEVFGPRMQAWLNEKRN